MFIIFSHGRSVQLPTVCGSTCGTGCASSHCFGICCTAHSMEQEVSCGMCCYIHFVSDIEVYYIQTISTIENV